MLKNIETRSITDKKLFYFLLFAGAAIIYLSICLPLHYLVDAFTIPWFVFGLLAFVCPFYFLFLSIILYPLEQNKKKNKVENFKFVAVATFNLWMTAVFGLCAFNGWLVGIWCFGLIVLLLNIFSLVECFAQKTQGIQLISIYIITIIALTVILIYMIPFKDLQEVIAVIIAAIYGGLMTLGGVSWSIKHNKEEKILADSKREEERRLEDKKKYCPLFNIFKCNDENFPSSFVKISINQFDGLKSAMASNSNNNLLIKVRIKRFILENTDYTPFYFRGIQINSKIFERSFDLFVKKDSYLVFDFDNQFIYLNEQPNIVNLIVEDLLGNIYNVSLGITKETKEDYETVEICGSRRIKL